MLKSWIFNALHIRKMSKTLVVSRVFLFRQIPTHPDALNFQIKKLKKL